jgi:hypothetical protein
LTEEYTITRTGKLTFEQARGNLKQLLGIEVVESVNEGMFALVDTAPYRLRRGQISLTAEQVCAIGEAALLYYQLKLFVEKVEAADRQLGAAMEQVGHITDFYAPDLKQFTGEETATLQRTVAGKSKPCGELLRYGRDLRDKVKKFIDGEVTTGEHITQTN